MIVRMVGQAHLDGQVVDQVNLPRRTAASDVRPVAAELLHSDPDLDRAYPGEVEIAAAMYYWLGGERVWRRES